MNTTNTIQKLTSRREALAAQLQLLDVKLADARTMAKAKLMADAAALGIIITDVDHDCTKGGSRRIYKVKNVGDAILEVLHINGENGMTITEIQDAIAAAGMTYSANYVAQKISGYRNSGYRNRRDYRIELSGDCTPALYRYFRTRE